MSVKSVCEEPFFADLRGEVIYTLPAEKLVIFVDLESSCPSSTQPHLLIRFVVPFSQLDSLSTPVWWVPKGVLR